LIDACDTYIRDLYTSDLDLDFSKIEIFTALQQLSFTSYDRDTFSTLSLLIDSFLIQGDFISIGVVDSALVTFSQNLKLSTEQKNELIDLLESRYTVSGSKKIEHLLKRVEDNLAIQHGQSIEIEVLQDNGLGIETIQSSSTFSK